MVNELHHERHKQLTYLFELDFDNCITILILIDNTGGSRGGVNLGGV